MIKVSYSMVATYLSCPYRYYLRYLEGLKSKKLAKPLQFGSDFHKLLEKRDNLTALRSAIKDIENTYYKMSVKDQTELGEDYISDLITIFSDYCTVYQDCERPIETEHEFLINIGHYKNKEVVFKGIIDEIYPDNIIGEHKTFKQRPSMDSIAMNQQICLYAKALEMETGKKVERVQWDFIKSVPASKPIWLEKSKRFSEAKNTNITPFSWWRACEEKGVKSEDIISKSAEYTQNIGNFFFRCHSEILTTMVESVWEDFKQVVKYMLSRGSEYKVKNITRDCSWCEFRPICYTEFTCPESAEYVKSREFTRREIKSV